MNRNLKHLVLVILIWMGMLGGQTYEHSEMIKVPDMSFLPGVFTGLDILEERGFDLIEGKRLAVLTNQASLNRNGIHLLDLLARDRDRFDVQIIFTPQHGVLTDPIRSLISPPDGIDRRFGAVVKNLWDRYYKPNSRDFRNVDMVVIDIQDTGVRYHTMMTTVTKMMEAASDYGKPVVLLDRPNPINGNTLEGPVVRPGFQSLLGYHLVPIRHGMTVGEYALMVNETGWIRESETCELTVVPMSNWLREMWIDETGLAKMPIWKGSDTGETLAASSGLGLLEGTNVSFGEGTITPFRVVGAPWLVSDQIIRGLKRSGLPGVSFESVTFRPDSLSPLIARPIYRGETCYGVRLIIHDRDKFRPVKTAVTILSLIAGLEPRRFKWTGNNYIDSLYGHNYLRLFIAQERDVSKLPATWSQEVIQFNQFRQKFLLY
ncbi:MAG: DUF1343 domain-containing protein [Candidatus Neomarinimicrobiota bacterium]|nr:DUF1343 domain-containing protein [Candidatus Neomarinimicrobiota bacterium]